MDPHALVGLPRLMALTSGCANLVVGIIDGPVALGHPDLNPGSVSSLPGEAGSCHDEASASCQHGTLVAGILAARRDSPAPGIAPSATFKVRSIFREEGPSFNGRPSGTPRELAAAIVDCVEAGAKLVNLSVAVSAETFQPDQELREAVAYACQRGALIISAVANKARAGSTTVDGHSCAIPVVAYDLFGRPSNPMAFGGSMGRGLGAPGEGVISLSSRGGTVTVGGTSVAAPFVTGAAALLWSLFPQLQAVDIRSALLGGTFARARSVVPPLMNAWGSYRLLSAHTEKEGLHESEVITAGAARRDAISTTRYTSPRI